MRIYILEELNSFKVFSAIIEGILLFKSDIYTRGLDLGGIDILIGKSGSKSGSKSLKEYIYWSLMNIYNN